MRQLLFAVLVGFQIFSLSGCGVNVGKKTPMELKDIPPDIMKIANEKLPGIKFDSAFKEANGNYELRGKESSGKVREIDIRPDGTIDELQ